MSALNEQPGAGVDVRDFLQAVVPWDGNYVTVHWQQPGPEQPFHGQSCRTVDDVLRWVAQIEGGVPANIWFCTSSQKLNKGRRSRKQAAGLVCIPIDLDIKSGSPDHYATLAEAIASLFWTCDQLDIPRPSFLVASGGGLHGYWISDRTLTVEEWQPYANAVKAAFKDHGLKFDTACTGDAARVMRVPNTKNWKYGAPRQVRLLQSGLCNGVRHDFAAVFGKILSEPKAAPGANNKIADPLPDSEIAEAFKDVPVTPLAEGIEYYQPLPVEPILAECAWLREAFETGGINFDEPQWNLTTLIATSLKDGHELAHKFGNQHSTYTEASTDKKWAEKNSARAANPKLGWPQCKTIEAEGSKHCKSCKHSGKIKSPLNLAWQHGYSTAELQRRAEQIAENIKIGNDVAEPLLPQIMTLEEMRMRLVFVSSTGAVADIITGRAHKKEHAADEFAASQHPYTLLSGALRNGPALKFWLASQDRKGVEVLAWVPGAGMICEPPEGPGPAFNMWRGLSPMAYPEDWQARVEPFLEHIDYLVPIAAEQEHFLQWLAHIFQVPEVLPHTSYLMITPVTGIGRNLLASILVRALRGFVAAGVSLPEMLDKGYTGRISQKLLIIVDEAREGSGERRYDRAERFKQIQTEEHRHVNPKYGHQSVEKNCARWLMFSNKDDAIPFDNSDRRIRAVANPTIRQSDAYYDRLYGLLNDNAFIGSVRHWAETKGITAFRPGEHAPMNQTKLRILNEMMSETERAVAEFKEDCKTGLTSRDAIRDHVSNTITRNGRLAANVNDMHLTHAIRRVGMMNTGHRILAYKKSDFSAEYHEYRVTVVIVRGEWTTDIVKKSDPGKLLEAMGLKGWSTTKPQS